MNMYTLKVMFTCGYLICYIGFHCTILRSSPGVLHDLLIISTSELQVRFEVKLQTCGGTDCLNDEPDMQEEVDKKMLHLLSEELKLQQTVSSEKQQHAELAFLDARRIASLYQKEAEKCNMASLYS